MPNFRLPSTIIALAIAALYILAGQAHFSARLTPELTRQIDVMTPHSFEVLGKPLGLSYQTTKWSLGAFDLTAAALLWRSRTKRAGLTAAVIGSLGGFVTLAYGGAELGQIGALVTLAVVGRLLVANGW